MTSAKEVDRAFYKLGLVYIRMDGPRHENVLADSYLHFIRKAVDDRLVSLHLSNPTPVFVT